MEWWNGFRIEYYFIVPTLHSWNIVTTPSNSDIMENGVEAEAYMLHK